MTDAERVAFPGRTVHEGDGSGYAGAGGGRPRRMDEPEVVLNT